MYLISFAIILFIVDELSISPNTNRIRKSQGRSMSIQSSDNGSNITLLSSSGGSSGDQH